MPIETKELPKEQPKDTTTNTQPVDYARLQYEATLESNRLQAEANRLKQQEILAHAYKEPKEVNKFTKGNLK